MPASETSQSQSTHVAIVGGGPIGLELAAALKRAGIEFQVFEAGALGQTISWWAPQTRWFSSNERISIAGVPLLTADQSKSTREQYLTYLRTVATQYEIDVHTHTPVTDVKSGDGEFVVTTKSSSRQTNWSAKAVVLAIGGTDYPKKLGIPGEDLPHVDGYLRETHRYFNRRVLVIGGRNSAIEAALRLHHAGAQVALSYRQEHLPEESIKYWLLPEIKSFLKSGRIRSLLGTVPIEFTERLARLRSLDGETIEVEIDDILSLIGYQQNKSLMRSCGIDLVGDAEKPSFDEATMQTNIPGIYVAGTAVAGTQSSSYKIFLENCHDHVDKIVTHLAGRPALVGQRLYDQQAAADPES